MQVSTIIFLKGIISMVAVIFHLLPKDWYYIIYCVIIFFALIRFVYPNCVLGKILKYVITF
jgi:hypothetical protein